MIRGLSAGPGGARGQLVNPVAQKMTVRIWRSACMDRFARWRHKCELKNRQVRNRDVSIIRFLRMGCDGDFPDFSRDGMSRPGDVSVRPCRVAFWEDGKKASGVIVVVGFGEHRKTTEKQRLPSLFRPQEMV